MGSELTVQVLAASLFNVADTRRVDSARLAFKVAICDLKIEDDLELRVVLAL